jgi:hypothetical protein
MTSNRFRRRILPWLILTSILCSTVTFLNLGVANVRAQYHADITLSNEQIQLWYTDEAAGIGNYTNDTVEPRGWELFPSIYWDSNGNTTFEDEESIISTIFPMVHYTESGTDYNFAPLHQSMLQQPGDATIVSAGWISEPNVYASEVQNSQNQVTVNSILTIYDGDNYLMQTYVIQNIGETEITDVHLIIYLGIDINGYFDDYAFIDTDTNNMIKAKDNTTDVWFGAYPKSPATNYELSLWDDGPNAADDLWDRCRANTLTGQSSASDDVEGALQFYLNDMLPEASTQITMYYSFAHNENDLYPPVANHPPYKPYNPTPSHEAINISLDTNLTWSGGDPDGDPVTYDIYFGNMSPPPQIESNWSSTEYNPPLPLEYNTTYYWYLVAWDDQGASNTSDEWNFTTETIELVCGDVTNDSIINVGDVVYLITYLYRSGSPPIPMTCVGDVNCDDIVNIGDVVYLITYLYRGGALPCPDCCNPPW